jgi:hypothetical protein
MNIMLKILAAVLLVQLIATLVVLHCVAYAYMTLVHLL